MTTRDLFEETYSAVTVNKVRSGLTMLGIVIGIASVIALVAVGQGSQASIQASIDSLGANLVMITPGAQATLWVGCPCGGGQRADAHARRRDRDCIGQQRGGGGAGDQRAISGGL